MKPTRWLVGLLAACTFGTGCRPAQSPERPAPIEAPAAGTGRIHGVVRLRGTPPAATFERVTKDTQVCGSQVPTTRLAMTNGGGVRNAFVYLENAPPTGPRQPRETVSIDQNKCEYSPHAITVPVGTQLDIANGDPILHNVHARQVTASGSETIFNIAQPQQGQRTLVPSGLRSPGIVALTCEAGHPWMTGYILVADHAFTAVTDADGVYEIAGVPPGTYRIRMWHEGIRLKRVLSSVQEYDYEDPYESVEEVVVPPDGETELNFDLELRP